MPKLPEDFLRWEGPWILSTISSYDGDTIVVCRQWTRMYREKSHCGKDGCCEMRYPMMGPVIDAR